MSIKYIRLLLYSIILLLSVFLINYIVRENSIIYFSLFQSEESYKYSDFQKREIDKFKSEIVRPKYNVSCRQLFEMNSTEINSAKRILAKLKNQKDGLKLLEVENFIFPKEKCALYKEIRLGERHKKPDGEPQMSLAYSILMYDNVEQFERLLNIRYNPNNIYCIHIDAKSNEKIKRAVKSIVDCFDNVFISTQLEHIVYAGFSRLKADLNCLNDLFNLSSLVDSHENLKNKRVIDWKYFLNMASSEFPLRTNYELTRILTAYNGSNEVQIVKQFDWKRIKKSWIENKVTNRMESTSVNKSVAPHNFKIVKGYAYCTLSRKFCEYAIRNEKVKDLLKWGEDTWSPDEWFWSTLQYNTDKYPTGFKETKDEKHKLIQTIGRLALWSDKTYKKGCKGFFRHGVCVFSIGDLPTFLDSYHFVANKFLLQFDPIVYQCMEEWYLDREKNKPIVNIDFYCDWIKPHSTLADCL